jgi:hypothetical protein
MLCSDLRCSTGSDAYRRIADLPVYTVLQTDFMALEGAKMNIFLSILGTAIVTILIAGAYLLEYLSAKLHRGMKMMTGNR